MSRSMNDAQTAAFKFQLHLILQREDFTMVQSIGQQADLVIKRAHFIEHPSGDSGAKQKPLVVLLSQTSKQMARFPIVNEYFSVLCLIANLFGQTAMILVRVRQDDPSNICK